MPVCQKQYQIIVIVQRCRDVGAILYQNRSSWFHKESNLLLVTSIEASEMKLRIITKAGNKNKERRSVLLIPQFCAYYLVPTLRESCHVSLNGTISQKYSVPICHLLASCKKLKRALKKLSQISKFITPKYFQHYPAVFPTPQTFILAVYEKFLD